MKEHRAYSYEFAKIYPLLVQKAERNGRTKRELNKIIYWLTGYDSRGLQSALRKKVTVKTFFKEAPKLNPKRKLITGVVCGVRVEEVPEKLMREIRYMDKLIDELARGRAMSKILREQESIT